MTINGSPDISVLQMQVTFDISGLAPVINIKNLSQGANLPGVTWWFVVTSPSGTVIHEGSFDSPDATGVWGAVNLTDSWPMPFNTIEWNGPYNVTAFAQDSLGNVYSDSSYTATIVRPFGNTSLSKNNYGRASTIVQVKCQDARIYFEDVSSTSYKGLTGTRISSVLRVIFPIDPTYSVPAPFVADFSTPVLVPVSYSSKNYQFVAQSFYTYAMTEFVYVTIQYQQIDSFAVLCNIDLVPLVCEYTKLIDSIENGSCGDVNEAVRKLTLINPKMALVMMGINQPLIGVDVPALIDDIIKIGGFDCDCCNAATGIIPQTASIIDGYSFSVQGVCGDITGSVVANGSNIIFKLQDKSYVFNLSAAIQTTAFTITPSTAGCVKTYTLNVNMTQFATDLADTILDNPSLVNLWRTIIPNPTGDFELTVQGKCLFLSSATYNYTFTLSNIPVNTTFALLTGWIVNGDSQSLSYSLNLTNLVAFQTYLNSLGLGSFTVTNPSGQTVLITSNANPNLLSGMVYTISSTDFIADFTSTAAGYVPVSANQVIQKIINRLCGLDDSQVVTSQDYTITYIDENGDVQTIDVPAGTSLADFIADLLKYNAITIANTGASLSVSCDNIKKQFDPDSSLAIGAKDFILATRGGGACAQVAYLDAFRYMVQAAKLDAPTMALFCDLVTACGAGLSCAPYDFLEVLVTQFNPACAQIVGIEFTLS